MELVQFMLGYLIAEHIPRLPIKPTTKISVVVVLCRCCF